MEIPVEALDQLGTRLPGVYPAFAPNAEHLVTAFFDHSDVDYLSFVADTAFGVGQVNIGMGLITDDDGPISTLEDFYGAGLSNYKPAISLMGCESRFGVVGADAGEITVELEPTAMTTQYGAGRWFLQETKDLETWITRAADLSTWSSPHVYQFHDMSTTDRGFVRLSFFAPGEAPALVP